MSLCLFSFFNKFHMMPLCLYKF